MPVVQNHEISILIGRIRLTTMLMASVAGVTAFGTALAGTKPDTSQLLSIAGAKAGIPAEQLKIASHFEQQFRLTGVTLDVTKVFDSSTGKATLIAVDEQDQPVDLDTATAREDRARTAKYGKIDPKLADQLATASTSKAIPVSIWVKVPTGFVPKRVQGESSVKSLGRAQAATAPARRSLVAKLKRIGGLHVVAAPNGPAVFAQLTPAQIRRAAAFSEVAAIYPQETYTNFQDDSATTERINPVWASGNLGQGTVRPAVHEPDAVSDGNPNLNSGTHAVVFYCGAVNSICPSGKNIGSDGGHASRVAGAIASTHPLDRGIAPNVQLVISENSQTFNDADLVRANEWGRGNGADPTNMSWGSTCPDGQQNFMSRYVDYAEKNFGQTFIISSGNTQGCAARDLQVSAPGLAFGAITVGAIRDSNTGFWNDDSISTFSRFQNPDFAPDLNKPEVVAVGEDQCLTNDSGIDCGNDGTSFSAPQVAGQVASMLSRQPGQNSWPEANKAAVLASAFHPIGTADQSGLGAVVMNVSDDTYRFGRFINECNATCNPLGVADFDASGNRDHFVSLTAGQVVKVAIAWDADSNPGGATDVIGADIDLSVLGPTNAFVCGSFSVNNTWESCQFTVPSTGTYTFREHLFGSEASWPGTFMGMAWSIKIIPNPCSAPAIRVPAAGATFANLSTANGPTFFDNYPGWGVDQSGRERVFLYTNTANHHITFTDTNSAIDLHIVRLTCSTQPIVPTVLAQGSNSASVHSAPPGAYYLIADGSNGFVGVDTFRVIVGAPIP